MGTHVKTELCHQPPCELKPQAERSESPDAHERFNPSESPVRPEQRWGRRAPSEGGLLPVAWGPSALPTP